MPEVQLRCNPTIISRNIMTKGTCRAINHQLQAHAGPAIKHQLKAAHMTKRERWINLMHVPITHIHRVRTTETK